jgi:hypothetical protein
MPACKFLHTLQKIAEANGDVKPLNMLQRNRAVGRDCINCSTRGTVTKAERW